MFDLRVVDAKVQGSMGSKTTYYAFWYMLDHNMEDGSAHAHHVRTSSIGNEPSARAESYFSVIRSRLSHGYVLSFSV